jgi:hypothetical protein
MDPTNSFHAKKKLGQQQNNPQSIPKLQIFVTLYILNLSLA